MQIRADAADAAEYRAAGWWGDDTIGSRVRRWATERGDAVAFVSGDTRFTWADYDAAADGIARALMAGAHGDGERVAVLMPDGPGVHAAFVGVERAGLVVVGIGHRAGDREIAPSAHAHRGPGAGHRRRAPGSLRSRAGGRPGRARCQHRPHRAGRRRRRRPRRRGARRGEPDRGGRRPSLRRLRPRRAVPAQLHLGHHRPAEVRDAHPEPVVLLPPAGRAGGRLRRRRGLLQRDPRPVRLRALDRALHPGHPRLPHGGDGPLRRRRGCSTSSSASGSRCCAA